MKKTQKNYSDLQIAVRFVGGILLTIAGIALVVLHSCKVAPTGWETSDFLYAITFVWAYTGPFVGIIVAFLGLHVSFIDRIIFRWLEKKGRL